MSSNNSKEEKPILKNVCLFNNSLKCHPLSIYNLATGGIDDATANETKIKFLAEKVCPNCPTYLFIKNRGIPR